MRALWLLLVPSLAWADRPELVARTGAFRAAWTEDGSGNEYDVHGWLVEGEAAWHLGPHLGLAAFAGYASAPDHGTGEDDCTWQDRDRFVDVGGRARAYFGGVFFGAGLAIERLSVHGPWMCPSPYSVSGTDDYAHSGLAIELHAGYTSPRLGDTAIALQIFAAASVAEEQPNTNDGLLAGRLAIGLAY